MFVQIYNFELLPTLTNCEHNSMDVVDVLNESSEVEQYTAEPADIVQHQKSFSRLPESSEHEPRLTELQSSSSVGDMLCASSEITPPLEVRISKKSSRHLPEAQKQLFSPGGQLQNSSSFNNMNCSSAELFPILEVRISQPLMTYTQVMQDENMVTSTQN